MVMVGLRGEREGRQGGHTAVSEDRSRRTGGCRRGWPSGEGQRRDGRERRPAFHRKSVVHTTRATSCAAGAPAHSAKGTKSAGAKTVIAATSLLLLQLLSLLKLRQCFGQGGQPLSVALLWAFHAILLHPASQRKSRQAQMGMGGRGFLGVVGGLRWLPAGYLGNRFWGWVAVPI